MNTEIATEAPTVLTEVKALSLPDMTLMSRGATSALRMAESFLIATEDDYQLAGEELQSIKARINKMEATRTGITGPMNKALTAINDLFRGPMATFKTAEVAIKGSMLTYYDEQERIAAEVRRQAEADADAERQRVAEAARQVELAAAAERQKIADEAAKLAAVAKAEHDRLAKMAVEAAAVGNHAAAEEASRAAAAARQQAALEAHQANERATEAADRASETAAAMRSEASVISAAVTHISVAKASGISAKSTVDFEVTNLQALVQHIAANPALISLVMADSLKLRAYVRGLGMNAALPGVRVFQKRSLSSRAA
jgi:uncharacterized membrane protein YqiK